MGKIIRNGIEYSGSYDNAISINYDNTNSGLNATTVQEGIDEIKEDLKPHANVNPIANLLTTETGYALDATQGKVLDDKISAVSDSLNVLGTIKAERLSVNTDIQNESSQAGYAIWAHRAGKIVTIEGRFNIDTGTPLTKNVWYELAQLPVGYRPYYSQNNFLFGIGITGGTLEGAIGADGIIKVRPGSGDIQGIVLVSAISFGTHDAMPT